MDNILKLNITYLIDPVDLDLDLTVAVQQVNQKFIIHGIPYYIYQIISNPPVATQQARCVESMIVAVQQIIQKLLVI